MQKEQKVYMTGVCCITLSTCVLLERKCKTRWGVGVNNEESVGTSVNQVSSLPCRYFPLPMSTNLRLDVNVMSIHYFTRLVNCSFSKRIPTKQRKYKVPRVCMGLWSTRRERESVCNERKVVIMFTFTQVWGTFIVFVVRGFRFLQNDSFKSFSQSGLRTRVSSNGYCLEKVKLAIGPSVSWSNERCCWQVKWKLAFYTITMLLFYVR